jgi:Rrf2 family nitric oxide-sensitive transcriptional repressor
MRLTVHADYALRTLIYVGLRAPERSNISVISKAYGISTNHLMKVVNHLSQAGLLCATRGRGGGLSLARKPEEIRVGDVIRLMEEDLAIVECRATGQCRISAACRLRGAIADAAAAFLAVLDRVTLADLIAPEVGMATARLLGIEGRDSGS